VHKITLKKPDGRALHLYSSRPIPGSINAPSPGDDPVRGNPHMRWHPLRGEWITFAAHRQSRPFLPPPDYNPLAPMTNPSIPTELPVGDYEIAVFDNRFPSLEVDAHDPPPGFDAGLVPTTAGVGKCEVVVFDQDPTTSLGRLPLPQIELLLNVWTERYRELGELEAIKYIMPFENRGVEMGVTLHHPHGQIYAYDHVPPVPANELKNQLDYYQKNNSGLLEDIIKAEIEENTRIVVQTDTVMAFIPAFARYPFETWIAPIAPRASLLELTDIERRDMAVVLKTLLLKFDHLFDNRSIFPYLMVMHQAPTDGRVHPEAHLHLEFYPPYRTKDKLKYLAGTELGAGLVAMDVLPEQKAPELRAVDVSHLL
jgi:UDPglucose--hexose-1-phosphate uridylyltransferase